MMKSRHTFCIASLLVLFSLLSDQLLAEEKAEEQQASKVIECSFLHWGDVPEEKLFFRMGEEYHPMTFRMSARAGKISLKRMAEFEVFRELENPVEGEAAYEFLASAAVPSEFGKLLFLVLPSDKEEGQYRVVAMDDSVEAFPRAYFLFVNLTEQMISVEFSGETQEVEVNENAVMQSNVDEKGGFIPCIMRDPDGETIYGTRLFAQPNGRELVLIRSGIREGNNRPRVKFISQSVAAPVPEPVPVPVP